VCEALGDGAATGAEDGGGRVEDGGAGVGDDGKGSGEGGENQIFKAAKPRERSVWVSSRMSSSMWRACERKAVQSAGSSVAGCLWRRSSFG